MPLKPKTARRNRRSFTAARLNRHAFASVGTDREIRGLRPSGRTLESTRCSLRCLCHRSLTRGPSIFSEEIDDMLTATGLTVLKTPVRVPQANAHCERLIGTIRRECLDWMIPFNETHLRRVLRDWVTH